MKKCILFLSFFLIFPLCACSDDEEKETYMEWVGGYVSYEYNFPGGAYKVQYRYHYWGDTIRIKNPTKENEQSFHADRYSIEILNHAPYELYIGTIAMSIVGKSNDNQLAKGSVLYFEAAYVSEQSMHISIKFYDTEIFNGTIYAYKNIHNKEHNLEKDD